MLLTHIKGRSIPWISLALILVGSASSAYAADLNYSADTIVTLTGSSPSVNLTISSGSAATSLVVNTTNVVVTIPASTLFAISSPYTLIVSGASSDAVITNACSGNTSIVTVGATTPSIQTLTLTVASYQCGGQSSSVGAGPSSSGGGGGGGYVAPVVVVTNTTSTPKVASSTTTSVAATNTSANLLTSLKAQLDALMKKLQDRGVPGLSVATNKSASFVFNKNLITGSKGEDVRALQQYLNNHGFVVAKSGAGSPGKETTLFGAGTRAALMKYQKSKGIVPASGFFGPLTRKSISNNP